MHKHYFLDILVCSIVYISPILFAKWLFETGIYEELGSYYGMIFMFFTLVAFFFINAFIVFGIYGKIKENILDK